MDAIIVNTNANLNAQNVSKVNVKSVKLLGGKLILHLIHGNVKKFVGIKLLLVLNNVMMVILMIKMVAKIVNISVELDVHHVIIIPILV